MTKRQIQNELTHRHISFAEYVLSLDKADFEYAYDNRWNAGQQLSHIIKSTAPILVALKLPIFVVKMLFGASEKPSVSYASIVQQYKHVLENGGKSTRMFLPDRLDYLKAEASKNQLLLTISKINMRLETFSEDSLDRYRLPHPLLGKLTIREMLYFTMYHVEHHMERTKENLRYVGFVTRS